MAASEKDRTIVRDLARRVAEAAADPIQEKKIAEWKRHNALRPGKPMVLQAPEGVWDEFVPADALRCEDEACRGVEHRLRTWTYKIEHFRDDWPVTADFHTSLHVHDSGWDIQASTTRNPEFRGVHGAVHYNTVIEDNADPEKLFPKRTLTVDWESSRRDHARVSDLVGDILHVEMRGHSGFWFAPMDQFIQWRGLDKMFFDLVDRPEWVHRVMEQMTKSHVDMMRQHEAANALALDNGAVYVGSGGMGTTDELPQPDFDGEHVRLKDLWGHATTQIFSEVSPAMHDEFAIPYEARFLSLFGLGCYGCCEPLHKKIGIIRKLPRVRRISMSPFVEPNEGAEQIGRDFIYSSKPNPSYLAADTWHIESCREEMVATLEAAKRNGCVVEFVMKDTHTCRGEPHRYDEWTDLAMQLAEEYA